MNEKLKKFGITFVMYAPASFLAMICIVTLAAIYEQGVSAPFQVSVLVVLFIICILNIAGVKV